MSAVLGTAYRTPIVPLFDIGSDTAIYAVWPPAVYDGGTTTLIGASTSLVLGDTFLFPAERSGELRIARVIRGVNTPVHRQALAAAGYELEVPS